jgi:hypothetical protein
MRWFRGKRRWGSYGALFALALQLALSFGHVHLDDVALGNAASVAVQKASEPGTPSGTVPDRDDVCAICAILSLSGSLLIPYAPALVFAVAQHEAFFADLVGVIVSDPARAQFQARAPPA